MLRLVTRVVAATTLAAMIWFPVAASASVGAGLWSATSQPANTIDDAGSVELGVKFVTSKDVNVVGIRAYRIDPGAVTGSLWTRDGARLAGPTGFGPATPGWQDVTFEAPVAIAPGETYIASYFAPNATYGFDHGFFSGGSFTAGPITALQSVAGDGNGVFCYESVSCLPTNTFADSNYWVTPLWAYAFTGFHQPVENGAWTTANAGSAIPVKFSLGGDQGLDVIKPGFPLATEIMCPDSSTPLERVEQTIPADGSLSYDAAADQYVYVWKTSKGSAGKCYRLELGLDDDTSHSFDVVLR